MHLIVQSDNGIQVMVQSEEPIAEEQFGLRTVHQQERVIDGEIYRSYSGT